MKVAVCVSGRCESRNPNTDTKRNIQRLKETFPQCEFYFGTWEHNRSDLQKIASAENCFYFEEPTVNCHPYDLPASAWASNRYEEVRSFMLSGGEDRWSWAKHHTKQHLIHALLCKKIEKLNYDVVIRTRFDVWIYGGVDFDQFISDTYINQRINAFATQDHTNFDKLQTFNTSIGAKHEQWIVDQMIIYPRKFLNPENVITLFQSDQLNPGEMGWYQVLNGVSNVEHRSFNGWVNHDRNVLTKFFYSSSGEMVRLRPAAIFSMVRDEVLRLRRTLMKRFRLFRKI